MFDWLRRFFRESDEDRRQRFFGGLDALNGEANGGKPVATTKVLGNLRIKSGTIVLGDPQYLPGLEIPIASSEYAISASLRRYPSGVETIKTLTLCVGIASGRGSRRNIGEIGIDSGKLVLADKADIQDHWTDVGKDRIGVISTAPNDSVLRLLAKRFKLKTIQVNAVRAEVVGQVSESLENEIKDYLKADPKYADHSFMYFRVQSNNTFDRVNYLTKSWGFIPIGNEPSPSMFVCKTGHGDGRYDVEGRFASDLLQELTITFINN